jgi:hypothetical protein
MMALIQQRLQEQQQQHASALETARTQPIPGLTGPTTQMPGQPTVGMAPPQQPLPMPNAGNHMFTPQGPYANQAMQMAGLLGGSPMMNPSGNMQTQQGLLGAPPKGFRIPFYRPVGK